jgi:hypothetical protein
VCKAERSASSGFVSFDLMRAITRLRVAVLRKSATLRR